jgi:hypothetical protein
MSLKAFAISFRARFKYLRARLVPVIAIMLLMMVLAVGFLTDNASAATTTDTAASDEIAGGPVYMWVLVIIAIACLILFVKLEEEILLYAFVGLLIATFALFIVG